MPSVRRPALLVSATALLAAAIGGCAPDTPVDAAEPGTPAPAGSERPNIVFVLTDDLAPNLVRYMPEVQRMQRDGVNFTDYTVTDSLCCPSRASILAGKYPHNTGVFTNSGADGGFEKFRAEGHENSTIGTQLQRGGYHTAFLGKYLNGYSKKGTAGGERAHVPPGWDTWAASSSAYKSFDYTLNENGKIVEYGSDPKDYVTDVLARKGTEVINQSTQDGQPFYLQLNTFAPHGPFTPAPRDRGTFKDVTAPRGPAFNEADVSDKAGWLSGQKPLSGKKLRKIDKDFAKRVRSVQAVDDMLASLRSTLERTGQADNTYVMFSSDNGFHMGEHRLGGGKQTAFDTDVVVPLTVTGPRVPAGRDEDAFAQNIDLRPTFGEIAGVDTPQDVDGRSMLPLLRGEDADWRTLSLIEHHGPNKRRDDPDRQRRGAGNPPTYSALRTPEGTYVEYANGDHEFYDRATDPHQLTNTYDQLPRTERDRLRDTTAALTECRGGDECWQVARPDR